MMIMSTILEATPLRLTTADKYPESNTAITKYQSTMLGRQGLALVILLVLAFYTTSPAEQSYEQLQQPAVFTVPANSNLQDVIVQIQTKVPGRVTLRISEGTYFGPFIVPSGMTLECASRKAILSIAPGANSDVVTLLENTSYVTIRNCTIDGNGSNQTSNSRGIYLHGYTKNIVMDNIAVKHAFSACIDTVDSGNGAYSSGFVLHNSTISDCGSHAINMWSMNDVLISGNTFSNWGQSDPENDAIASSAIDTGKGIQPSKNYTIINNTFNNKSATKFGIELFPGHPENYFLNVNISRNTINGGATGSAGFSVTIHNGTISRNVFNNPTVLVGKACAGLCELSAANLTVSENIITNGNITLIGDVNDIGGYTVVGNTIISNYANTKGIILSNEGYSVKNVTIARNTIIMPLAYGSCAAIQTGPPFYGNDGGSIVTDVKISHNTMIGSPDCASALEMHSADGTERIEFSNNYVSGYVSLYSNWAEPVTGATDVRIFDNTLQDISTLRYPTSSGTGIIDLWDNKVCANSPGSVQNDISPTPPYNDLKYDYQELTVGCN